MKNIIQKTLKVIIAFIIGIIISVPVAYAAIYYASSDVGYDNSSSDLSSTNVQDALDELNTRSSEWVNVMNMGTPQYYAFGTYKGWCTSTDTGCNSYSDFPTTSTTPPSGKVVYAAKYADGQYGVCVKRNGNEHCFRGRNWKAEAKHIQKVFSDISCDVDSSIVYCFTSDFRCNVSANGNVFCYDNSMDEYCLVYHDGSVDCIS